MDLALTTALVILALCAPGAWAPPAPQTPTVPVGSPGVSAGSPTSADRVAVTRVSLSTALLGRRVAVASAATPVAAPEPIVQEQGSQQPETAASPQPQAISEPGSLPWGDPRRLAVCTRDGILRSVDGGQTWTAVPTDGVATLAAGSAMPLAPLVGDPPGCQSVTLDPNSPDVFYAVFEGVKPPQDAPPPWFAAGYVTRDAGQTWEPVPALSGARFGGFTTETGTVQALYAPEPSPPSTPPHREAAGGPVIPPLVQESTDGGQTWTQIPFSCPDDGPCIRWGVSPAATGLGSCAMH
ncbi:MAG: WD40/YVTN/BNR-like repeat-containing protein, partial [Chloroflexota bacterium]